MIDFRPPRLLQRSAATARAFAPAALALVSLALCGPATAQETFDVTVYHSADALGADPRPASPAPPGCVATGGGGGGPGPYSVLVFGSFSVPSGPPVTELAALGHSVTQMTTLPPDLSPYDVIWYVGINVLTAAEQSALAAFLAGGGGVYLTGERPCCETSNDAVETLVNTVVVGASVTVGDQGDISGPYAFNPAAVGGITTTPNALTEWSPAAPGGLAATAGLDADNILTTGAGGVPVAAVWDSSELAGGAGRLVLMMDVNWFTMSGREQPIENLQTFLGSGSGSGFDCVIHGTANEELELWIDGGPTASGDEEVCMLGAGGGSGDELCGADILFQLSGVGEFQRFVPDAGMSTLVYKPDCVYDAESEQCLLPPGTTQLRLNFLSGLATPGTGPRRVGSLFVNSTGLDESTPTSVTAFGEAAGANLQLRPIASPADPEIVAVSYVPEPGGIVQLASGLFGLVCLYRLRKRS